MSCPVGLRFFGSLPMRELDAVAGFLARASSTRFGVGRHMDRATRRAWRAGLRDRSNRRMTHRLFRDGSRNRAIQRSAETALSALADRPTITIFGSLGDYFGFQRQWRQRRPGVLQHTIPRGFHFPMCDDPALVARYLDDWMVRGT